MTHVGNSPAKEDAIAKAVGDTVYGDDLRLPGELIGKVIRAEEIPARILKIDPSRALAFTGVHCVLTAEDIPGANEGRYPYYPVLAGETVCFTGDAVAILAAESWDLAEEAARLVRVDYEPLPGLYEFENFGGEPLCDWKIGKGDLEAGFAEADVVVENVYYAACVDHAFIEPEGGVAWVDERGDVNVRVPTQTIENYKLVAATLGLPASRVRYESPMLGGAFGGKEHPLLGAYLGLLAMRTGRPVRIAYTREKSMAQCSKKHPFIMRYKTGATREGKLTALEVDILADAGAYPTNSGGLVLGGLIVGTGPYTVANASGRARAVQTNNPFTEAMRGVGANQVCFAYESQMDEVAKEIGMDPLEFRRKNFIYQGQTLMQGQPVPTRVMLPQLADEIQETSGVRAGPGASRGPWRRGMAYTGNLAGYGRLRQEGEAYVSLEDDGSVNVRCGASDVGAGQTHTYRQIAAESLGVPIERVSVVMADSHVTPLCGITAGSRQTLISGGATQRSGEELRSRLLRGAAEVLEAPLEDLEILDGTIHVRGSEERAIPYTEAIKACRAMNIPMHCTAKIQTGVHNFEGHEKFGDRGGWIDYVFGMHAAEVEVNIETGEVRLINYWAGHDVGQAIHPQHVEGQIEGGAMMGIGHGLMEEIKSDRGRLTTDHFESYLIPTAAETPEWTSVIAESGEGVGPYGAKGIGEPPCTAAAVACAVSQAIGARITRIPITPDHVMEVMGKIKK
jgi:CO/xanthine dehydrogenase Mo-binding subunit